MDLADIIECIAKRVCSPIDLLASRMISHMWLKVVDIELLKRRCVENSTLRLTLPQYIIAYIANRESKNSIDITYRSGFGRVALYAAFTGLVFVCSAKTRYKECVAFFKRYGLDSRVVKWTKKNVIKKDSNSIIFVSPNVTHNCIVEDLTSTDVIFINDSGYCNGHIRSMIADSQPRSLKKIILNKIKSQGEWPGTYSIDIPRRQGYLLYPEAIWHIHEYNVDSEISSLNDIIAQYKKICVIGSKQTLISNPSLVVVNKPSKLAIFKRKTAITFQHRDCVSPKDMSCIDCLVLVVDDTWTLNELIGYTTHYSDVKTFDLHVLSTPLSTSMCELARIKSYRPWLANISGDKLNKSIRKDQIEVYVTTSLAYTDMADKCITTCNPSYMKALGLTEVVLDWWRLYKTDASILTENTVKEFLC